MINIEISPGEFWDRMTILVTKLAATNALPDRAQINDEISRMINMRVSPTNRFYELMDANRGNFDHIETIAQCLAADDTTSDRFQQAVRGAFAANALRAAIKRRINEEAGWTGPQEVKTDAVMGVT